MIIMPPFDAKPGPVPAVRAPADARSWWTDAALIALIVALWWCWLYPEVARRRPVVYDTFRDAAAAENVLAGRWPADPMTVGQPYWYAPLGPKMFALVSRLTGPPPLAAYAYSILWLNVLLPVGWYVLARRCWGRRAGVAAVPLVWLGSRWWSFHIAMPMTSVHGVVLLIGVLLAWLGSLRRRRRWAVAVGVALALCTWHHIQSGMIAAAAITLHALAGAASRGANADTPTAAGRREAVLRMSIVAGVCAILVLPLAWHLLSLPIVNRAPIEYVSTLLRNPEFALQTRTWLAYPLAVVGLMSARKQLVHPAGVVMAYGLASAVGQGWGYLRVLADLPIPVLTPHEFQWNFQIAVGLFAAAGAARMADAVAARIERWWPATRVSRALLMLPVVVLVLQRDAPPAYRRKSAHWLATGLSASRAGAVDWIRQNTGIDDVFLASEPLNYVLVAGRTGRKVVCPPEGHANVAVDVGRLARDRRAMLETADPSELREMLARYRVSYVLLADQDVNRWKRWASWGLFEPVREVGSRSLMLLRVARP